MRVKSTRLSLSQNGQATVAVFLSDIVVEEGEEALIYVP